MRPVRSVRRSRTHAMHTKHTARALRLHLLFLLFSVTVESRAAEVQVVPQIGEDAKERHEEVCNLRADPRRTERTRLVLAFVALHHPQLTLPPSHPRLHESRADEWCLKWETTLRV